MISIFDDKIPATSPQQRKAFSRINWGKLHSSYTNSIQNCFFFYPIDCSWLYISKQRRAYCAYREKSTSNPPLQCKPLLPQKYAPPHTRRTYSMTRKSSRLANFLQKVPFMWAMAFWVHSKGVKMGERRGLKLFLFIGILLTEKKNFCCSKRLIITQL